MGLDCLDWLCWSAASEASRCGARVLRVCRAALTERGEVCTLGQPFLSPERGAHGLGIRGMAVAPAFVVLAQAPCAAAEPCSTCLTELLLCGMPACVI